MPCGPSPIGYPATMTEPKHEPPAEPTPDPDTEAKPGVNDPDAEGTGSDEPLTSL